ncbi:hypothetical protein ABZU05_05890 [Sneathia vaginalis]|uniref:DUF6162 family protein n=1 Tax=Sneathia vaginalis TaxID=187101 RepID=UPI0035C77195
MIIIKKELIKPASPKSETINIIITIILLILFAGILLHFTNTKHYTKSVTSTQISSIDLNNEEISIFTNLGLFAQDYKDLKSDNKDLSPKVLDEQLLYAPFCKDASWEDSGKHKWTMFTHENYVYYVGISSDKNIAGDFFLVINAKTFEYKIRYTKNFKDYDKLSNNKETLAHAINQFKEIVAYTGDDLAKETKGN